MLPNARGLCFVENNVARGIQLLLLLSFRFYYLILFAFDSSPPPLICSVCVWRAFFTVFAVHNCAYLDCFIKFNSRFAETGEPVEFSLFCIWHAWNELIDNFHGLITQCPRHICFLSKSNSWFWIFSIPIKLRSYKFVVYIFNSTERTISFVLLFTSSQSKDSKTKKNTKQNSTKGTVHQNRTSTHKYFPISLSVLAMLARSTSIARTYF